MMKTKDWYFPILLVVFILCFTAFNVTAQRVTFTGAQPPIGIQKTKTEKKLSKRKVIALPDTLCSLERYYKRLYRFENTDYLLTHKEYHQFLKAYCKPAYRTYQSGVTMITMGSLLVYLSYAPFFIGSMFYFADYPSSDINGDGFADGKVLPYRIYENYYYHDYLPGIFIIAAGVVMVAGGITLIVYGADFVKKRALNCYNKQFVPSTISLRFKISPNALGLVLKF